MRNRCVFLCMNTDKICIFTDKRQACIRIKAARYSARYVSETREQPVDNLSNYDSSAGADAICGEPLGQTQTGSDSPFCNERHPCVKLVDGAEFDVTKTNDRIHETCRG